MVGKRALSGVALILVASACGSDASLETLGRTRQAILGGTSSDESQDAVVMIVHLDPAQNKRIGICTGALIAPRLVLTARHCVSRANQEIIACDVDGTPLMGGEISGDFDAPSFFVFTGPKRPEFIGFEPPALDTARWKPAGQALEIINDKAGTLCNHDLALLLLKDPIANVPIASLRLDSDTAKGEKLLTVGWGVSSGEVEPGKRQQRTGVNVKRVGPDAQIPVLTKSEFLFDESICLGDSGGPIFSEQTKAIVGVVSRGGNGTDPTGGGPASTCDQADNVGTKLSAFRELVMDGFKRAGAEPSLEPKVEEDCSASSAVGAHHTRGFSMVMGLLIALIAASRRRRRSA